MSQLKTLKELMEVPRLQILSYGKDGGYGNIYKPASDKPYGTVVWSNGGGWEHVSISPYKHSITPSWDDMCMLKDMFFYDEETVVQFHPPKSEYVNLMENCLHLWRPINGEITTPPNWMV